jgi:hypothetical protein
MARPNLQTVPAAVPDDRPKLVVTCGRGRTGKSTFVRIMVERAQESGREVVIADADRTNATLSSFFQGVVRPEFRDDRSVHDWLDAVVNQQAADRATVVLDAGGGDQVFKGFAAELELASLLETAGIVPVALHFIGADVDDLSYLHELAGAFNPPQTALVLNEGVLRDGRPAAAAFKPIREHRYFKEAVARGAREIVLPRLGCMGEVNERRLAFAAAETDAGIGLTNRQRVAIWRRQVEKALAPIAEWLP